MRLTGKTTGYFAAQAVLLAGTLLIGAPSHASDLTQMRGSENSMRNLRIAHPNLSRQEIRQLVRVERRQDCVSNHAIAQPAISVQNLLAIPQLPHPPEVVRPVRPLEQSQFQAVNGRMRSVSRGVELDLTSQERTITLGDNLFGGRSSYTISNGSDSRELVAGSKVSASEYVALQQVIESGSQTLVLDSSGKAIGGSFSLSSIDDGGRDIHAKSLVVPASVEASGDFSRRSDFRLTGDLSNFGSILALSSNGNSARASIAARDITNGSGASIETVSSGQPMDLNLRAERNFHNDGLISASGNLTISAGGNFQSSGSINGGSLTVDSAVVRNSGALIATSGDVVFTNSLPTSLQIDSSGGRVSAENGAIKVRDRLFHEKLDTVIQGGDWISERVEINAGEGHLDVNVGELTGAINAHAGTVIINAQTEVLNIQELSASGDPLISNTNSIVLGSQVTLGAPLSVVSGGNITLDSATLDTTSSTGHGGDILLLAGAEFTIEANVLQVTGASFSGGNVTYTGTAPVIDSSSTSGNAGNVVIAAFSSMPGTGQVSLANSTITANGSNAAGSVSFIAGGDIEVGAISAQGSLVSGDISLQAAQPISNGTFRINATTGSIESGPLFADSTATGTVSTYGALTSNGFVTLRGTSVAVHAPITTSSALRVVTPELLVDATTMTARTVDVRSPQGDLTIDGGTGSSLIATSPDGGFLISLGAFSGGDLVLQGTMNLTGDAQFNSTASVVSQDNSLYSTTDDVFLSSSNWIQQGSGNIVANSITFGGSNIVNADGDVVILNDLIFSGRDLFIGARGDVDLGNYNIDLSSATGNGGSLTIIAGYTLSGSGLGQIQTANLTSVTDSFTTSSNIYGSGNYTTDSSAASGNAGNISIAATGTIILTGNLSANSLTGSAGTIAITGEDGVSIAETSAVSGSDNTGAVFIQAGHVLPAGLVSYRQGAQTGGIMSFGNPMYTAGQIDTGAISASAVKLQNLAAPINIGSTIDAHGITINTEGSINLLNQDNLTVTEFNTGDGGTISIAAPAFTTASGQPLQLIARGTTGTGGRVTVVSPGELSVGTSSTDDISIDVSTTTPMPSTAGGFIVLTAAGNLSVDASGAIAGQNGEFTFTSHTGQVLVTGALTGKSLEIDAMGQAPFIIGGAEVGLNGIQGTLSFSDNVNIVNRNGNIDIADPTQLSIAALSLRTFGSSSITLAKGSVLSASSSITLQTESSDIGKGKFYVDAPALSLTSGSGAIDVVSLHNGDVELIKAQAGDYFSLTASQGLRVTNGARAEDGAVTLVAGGGTLQILDPVVAVNGRVAIQNTDTVNGTIQLGDTVTTTSAGKGSGKDIIIAIGKLKKTNANNAPQMFITVVEDRGRVRFGKQGVTPAGPATVFAIGRSVYFNNQGAGQIIISTGANIRAEK